MVAELIRRGQLTPEQAAVHPHRSIITRALGTEETVRPDILELSLDAGDRVMLCSDGLSGMVPEDELEMILGTGDDPQAVADGLVEAALRHGGEDNVTVVVIFAVESAEEAPDDAHAALDADRSSPAAVPGGISTAGEVGGVGPDGFGPLVRDPVGTAAGPLCRPSSSGRLHRCARDRGRSCGGGAFAAFNSTVFFVGTTQGQVAFFEACRTRS